MTFKSIVTIAIALSITACGDSNDKAVGLYKYNVEMRGIETIAEVKKEGDVYLFIEDAIRKSNALALTETADGLSYNNIPLKLSEDGNTFYFGPINGIRVDGRYLAERLEAIENNKIICATLQQEVNDNKKNMSKEQWNAYNQSLGGKTPDDCHIVGAGMAW